MKQAVKAQQIYTGTLIVPDFSDVELRGKSLLTSNPSSFGEIGDSQPRLDEHLTFIAQYESEDDLICAFGHHHKRGFLLRGEAGLNHLIGCDCAHSRYGIEWDAFVGRVEAQMSRQRSLAWLHSVSGQILNAKAEMLAAVEHPAVAAFDQLRRTVRELPQVVLRAFQAAAHSPDTWLRGDFGERDLSQERKNKEKAHSAYKAAIANGDSRQIRMAKADLKHCEDPVFVVSRRAVLRVPAKSVWHARSSIRPRLVQIADSLLATAETLAGSREFNHPDMVAKSITNAAALFDATLDEIDDAVAMFAPATLEALAQWLSAEDFRGVSTSRLPQGISISDDKKTVILERTSSLKPVSFRLGGRFHLGLS
ncbi:hypothetical protein B5V01_06010 [Mesorhizobium erdmanii]|uniref:Uncharacterized protein n=2 Tax=Mesorhizobium TaxID=68287 RepID=A0A3M9XAG4_9HYPH|nr:MULTISPECIES: hypothetical protein [Mesorhizobium]RNJ44438.1 hypothetical protein DNR46_17520 [Mesorhizobium japonicum]RXT49449.1 hypothetical protein B5V01_06010 [Mesorhizobium erdmanii]